MAFMTSSNSREKYKSRSLWISSLIYHYPDKSTILVVITIFVIDIVITILLNII